MKQREDETKWYHLLPLMFIVTIVPLIVYLKVVPLTGASYEFWNGSKENFDFFSYYKGVALLLATSIALFAFVARFFQSGTIQMKKDLILYYISVGVYLLLVIGSTLFAEYKSIAISGFPDRYEGVYILVAYILIFLITTCLISREKHIKIMLGSLIVGAMLVGIIGLFQFLGYDLWKSSFGKNLLLPSQYSSLADKLDFSSSEHTIYATLFHNDFVGSYMAMIFPLSFSLFVLAKKRKFKVLMAVMTVLMAVNWLGCNSRAGLVGGVLALMTFVILVNKLILKHGKYFGAGLIVAFAIFFGLNQVSNGYLASRVNSLVVDAKALVGLDENTQPNSNKIPLKDIKINGTQATIETSTEALSFTYIDNQLKFEDSAKNNLNGNFDSTSGKVTLKDPRYKDYKLLAGKLGNNNVLKVDKGDIKLTFDLKQSGISLIDNKGKVVDLRPVEAWGFEGNERLGSSRGYIWSRSLPLLKNTLILGNGPDTFAAYFPQNDIKGKMYAYYGDMWQIVDKPHNLYLQIALNTGVVSLLAILMLLGLYITKSLRLYFSNSYKDFLPQVGVSIFVAIIGYLGAAFFNDSVVSVAPVFWILLSLGVSVNQIISDRDKCKNSVSMKTV